MDDSSERPWLQDQKEGSFLHVLKPKDEDQKRLLTSEEEKVPRAHADEKIVHDEENAPVVGFHNGVEEITKSNEMESMQELKSALSNNSGVKRKSEEKLSSMQELKRTLETEQQRRKSEEEERPEETKTAEGEESDEYKKQVSPPPIKQSSQKHSSPLLDASSRQLESKLSEPIMGRSAAAPEQTTPPQQQQKTGVILTSQSQSELQTVGHNLPSGAIFISAPIIRNIEVEYVVGTIGVGHLNFVVDLEYEEHQWRILFHRQNLIEYHAGLKSHRFQKQLGVFNPFRCWGKKEAAPEEIVQQSIYEQQATSNDSFSRGPTIRNIHDRRHHAIREIHFPRVVLMFDRHHFFHKNINIADKSSAAQEIIDQLKNSVREYLTAILASEHLRNLPATLDLLRCSALSFDKSLGPSVIEGWVMFQKHPPSMGAIQWHSCRTGCIVCNCACLPISNSRRYKAWIVVKGSFAAFLKKPMDVQPFYMVLFDSGFDVFKGYSTTGRRKHIYLHSNTTVADLTFSSRNEKKQWADHLRLETTATSWHLKDHPYGSFAPEREDRCFVKALVDGHSYFEAVADGLEAAQRDIYISGWWITPDFVLKRNTAEGNEYWKLSSVLKRRAAQGVKVYVLMYKEVEVAIALNSRFQESRIAKTENIYVLRHPQFTLTGSWYWSHHEKLVVCDGVLAFMGGLDLCWGRYDSDAHQLLDLGMPQTWPGLDYYNPRIMDIADPRMPDKDILNRETDPRMPWHDVACTVSGPIARDLARHFIHQWNFGIETKSGSRFDLPLIMPRDFPAYPEPKQDHCKVKCQVLRSLPEWSGCEENNPERSIQDAYIAAIADAQRYVYIENQFFVSGVQGDTLIKNRIADALYMRISRAAAEKKDFRVFIFIPLLPAFEGSVDDSSQAALRQVLFWQYRSICRGEKRRSLWQMLEDNPDVGDPSKYIAFFGLRTFDKTQVSMHAGENGKDKLFSEMVYIHSKIMIVDDHIAFIGSANINDRSMTGERDSELCVKFMDTVFRKDAILRGETWPLSGCFAFGLRMKLFEEHFGDYLPQEVMEDCVLQENFEKLKGLAKRNTECYEKVFALVPSDRILTFADLRRSGNTGPRANLPLKEGQGQNGSEDMDDEDEEFSTGPPFATGSEESNNAQPIKLMRLHSFSSLGSAEDGIPFKEKLDLLNDIYGHVVEFPLKFLSRAKRLKPAAGMAGVLGDQIFT